MGLWIIEEFKREIGQDVLVIQPFEFNIKHILETKVDDRVVFELAETGVGYFRGHDPAAEMYFDRRDESACRISPCPVQYKAMDLAIMEARPLPEPRQYLAVVFDEFVRLHSMANEVVKKCLQLPVQTFFGGTCPFR